MVIECVYTVVCRNDTSNLQRLLLQHTHARRTLPSKLATPVGQADQARQAGLSSGWLTQANGTWWKQKKK